MFEKERAGSSQSTLVSINKGLPALSKGLFDKIGVDEYIDYTDLPTAKGKPRFLSHYLDGQLLLVQLQDLEDSRCIISDFPTWVQRFTVYAAALCMQQSQRFAQLVAYQSKMATYAKSSGCQHGSYTIKTSIRKRERLQLNGHKCIWLSTYSASWQWEYSTRGLL